MVAEMSTDRVSKTAEQRITVGTGGYSKRQTAQLNTKMAELSIN